MHGTESPRAATDRPAAFTRVDLLCLSAVLLLGLVNLPMPYMWDQAFFTLGAQRLHAGGVLYRDFWDVKPPGIFLFYLVDGSLFGFSEIGIHIGELLYLMVFSIVLLVTLRSAFAHRWCASLVPLLSIGYYYACAGDWHLTQAEELVGLPLFLSLWFAHRAVQSPKVRYRMALLSGLAGGFVILFKLNFLLVPAGFWLAALILLLRERPAPSRAQVAIAAGLVLAGLLAPLAAATIWLGARGALSDALSAMIFYPLRTMTHARTQWRELVRGLIWFAQHWAPLMGLGTIGALLMPRRPRDLMRVGLLLWLALGFIQLITQRWSYWEYQFVLFCVPLAILAAHGVDALAMALERSAPGLGPRPGLVLAGGLVALCCLPLGEAALKALYLASERFALTPESHLRFQLRMTRSGMYERATEDTAPLMEPAARPGPLFVVGSPLYNWVAHRDFPGPRLGGTLTVYATADDWAQMSQEIRAAHTPYVFIQKDHARILARRRTECASFLDLLAREYKPVVVGQYGTLYQRRPELPARG